MSKVIKTISLIIILLLSTIASGCNRTPDGSETTAESKNEKENTESASITCDTDEIYTDSKVIFTVKTKNVVFERTLEETSPEIFFIITEVKDYKNIQDAMTSAKYVTRIKDTIEKVYFDLELFEMYPGRWQVIIYDRTNSPKDPVSYYEFAVSEFVFETDEEGNILEETEKEGDSLDELYELIESGKL